MSAVRDAPERGRFELEEEGRLAYADYRREGDVLAIPHVYADPALRGRGAAGRLMQGVADHARLWFGTLRSYVNAHISRNKGRGDEFLSFIWDRFATQPVALSAGGLPSRLLSRAGGLVSQLSPNRPVPTGQSQPASPSSRPVQAGHSQPAVPADHSPRDPRCPGRPSGRSGSRLGSPVGRAPQPGRPAR